MKTPRLTDLRPSTYIHTVDNAYMGWRQGNFKCVAPNIRVYSKWISHYMYFDHVFLHSYNNRYSNKNKRFELSEVVLSAWIEYRKINLRSSYFNTLTNLSRPKLPLISAVKSNTALQSTAADKDQREQQQPYIYWQQGRDTLLRIVQTGKGIEGQSITRAHIHSLVSIILHFCYQTLLL